MKAAVSFNGGPAIEITDAKLPGNVGKIGHALKIGGGVLDQTDIEDKEPGGVAADRLRSIIERVERLEGERKALAEDIKDIFAEAKSAGFDVKVIRQLIAIRRQEPAEVEQQETLLDIYRNALGMA